MRVSTPSVARLYVFTALSRPYEKIGGFRNPRISWKYLVLFLSELPSRRAMGCWSRVLAPASIPVSVALWFAYSMCFFEAMAIVPDVLRFGAVGELQAPLIAAVHHLSFVYTLELLLAACGICAMAGGWVCSELVLHHLPYAVAVTWCCACAAHAERWAPALAISLLTSANEGMLIAERMSPTLAQARRVYGFCVISALALAEMRCYCAAMVASFTAPADYFLSALWWADTAGGSLALGAIWYHAQLLRMYVRRWAKKRSL